MRENGVGGGGKWKVEERGETREKKVKYNNNNNNNNIQNNKNYELNDKWAKNILYIIRFKIY